MSELAIAGGGSWGTALALVLSSRFSRVRLWVHNSELAERMAESGENDTYLPGFLLPRHVEISASLGEVLDRADVVLVVTPSQHVRATATAMLPFLDPAMMIVSAIKGLEAGTLLRMSEVLGEVAGTRFPMPIAVLSGPAFAREVAAGDPTALVVASAEPELARAIQALFSGPSFRLYTNPDVAGVELGGALKNIIAIAAGVCHGLNLGSNSLAALVTRGLAEISRLAEACGAHGRTLAGLAGLGDLVLTCTGELSRNRRVGVELANGRRLEEILASMPMVAEGVQTTYTAVDLARRHKVDVPIADQVYAILRLGKNPRQGIGELMERSLKGE